MLPPPIVAPLGVHVYAPTLTTTLGAYWGDLGHRLDAYEHTITATFGFESCRVIFGATMEEALDWLDNLMASVVVADWEGRTAWEGYIHTVDIRAGGRSRSKSITGLANRVRCRYTTVLGTPGATARESDTASIARYGTHDGVVSVAQTTASAALVTARRWLAQYAYPGASPTTTLATGERVGAVEVALLCEGWYGSLGFVTLDRTDTTSESVTDQVGALLGSSSPGIAATNAFLSTSTAGIVATGASAPRTIAADTTYRQAIESRLAIGDTADERLAWGVYEDRTLRVKRWAGATPATIDYRVRFGQFSVEDGNGTAVLPWQVRPDAMVEDLDFAEAYAPSTATDSGARFYCERVGFQMNRGGMQLTLEPAATTGIDARIARLSL